MKGALLFFLQTILAIQVAAQPDANSLTSISKAHIVFKAEVDSATKAGSGMPVSDAVLRVLSIEDKYQLGISVVTRSKVDGKTPADAIVHDAITEVYSIIEGSAILKLEGTLDSAQRIPANSSIVLNITGPSLRGKSISGGRTYEVGPGDIIVIPPNIAHGFIELKTDKIVYTLIRVDPGKVLALKN